MNPDKDRKRARDLRWAGFQSLLVGIVLAGVAVLFGYMYLNDDTGSRHHVHLKGSSFLLFIGFWGLCMIVRGIIYFIRAFSGNEQYAKNVEDVIDKVESNYEAIANRRTRSGSLRNVLILLFLFLALAGAIAIGYLYWTSPR